MLSLAIVCSKVSVVPRHLNLTGVRDGLPSLSLDLPHFRGLYLLPDEIPALKTLIEAQRVEIAHLKLLVAKLRRQPFGRRSEKMAELLDQLELQLEELETGDAARASIIAPRAAPRRVRTPRALPDHLPREIPIHEPDLTQCPDCGGPLKPLGEEVSEMLEYVPARFRVIRHVRPKCACSRCDRIVQASAPSRPIAQGLAGPQLAALQT